MLIAMGHVTGTPQVTMRLYADNSDTLGSQIDSYYVTTVNTGSFGAGTEVITRDVSDAGWTVTAVQNYWLMAQSATDTWLAWNFSTDDGVYGRAVINNSGSPGYFDGVGLAIRLEAVPEPASMIALGAGLLAVARRRRKAKANHSDSRLPELTRVQGVFRL
ncbi:MAG TPA: PEP-CTERM sorting domain-containing protein [Fimbriimonadaceae bacterium]|nr:PEP-CTERM sorting domain-containing protein [Fimbriimonadaceae bacterium]